MKSVLTLLSFVIFVSCGNISSEDVSQSVIVTNYSFSYNEGEAQAKASGHFTLKKSPFTYVKLSSPSELRINNELAELDKSLFGEKIYSVKVSKDNAFQEQYFTYFNSDGERFNNSAHIPSKVEFNISNESEEGIDLLWYVENSDDDATSMSLYVFNSTQGQTILMPADQSRGTIKVVYDDLTEMQGDSFKIMICRENYKVVKEHPGASGNIKMKYCSTSKEIIKLN